MDEKFSVWTRLDIFTRAKKSYFVSESQDRPPVAEFPISTAHDEERQQRRAIILSHLLNGYITSVITDAGIARDKMMSSTHNAMIEERKLIEAEQTMLTSQLAMDEANRVIKKISAKAERTAFWKKTTNK